jgi:hypothetical protein
MPAETKPLLSWDQMRPGQAFRPFRLTVDRAMVERYEAIVGGTHASYTNHVPTGFAGILGRRSYLQDHDMPPGGVLLEHGATWLRPARLDTELVAIATVTDRVERDGRRSVLVVTTVSQDGCEVARILSKLGWPA